MTHYSAVLFDMDGTLLNTLDDLTNSVNHALAVHGYPTQPKDAVRGFIGNGMERLIQLATPPIISDEARAQVLASFKSDYAAHDRVETRPYDGIGEMLATLRQRDIQTARNAGVACLCVTWGFCDEAELLQSGAAKLAHTPGDVCAFVLGKE